MLKKLFKFLGKARYFNIINPRGPRYFKVLGNLSLDLKSFGWTYIPGKKDDEWLSSPENNPKRFPGTSFFTIHLIVLTIMCAWFVSDYADYEKLIQDYKDRKKGKLSSPKLKLVK